MKRIAVIISIILLLGCVTASAVFNRKEIISRTLFSGTASAIAGSGNSTSVAIELEALQPEGYFSFTLTTIGAGSAVKAEYLLCNTISGTYYEPTGELITDIVASHEPGTAIYYFNPPVAKYMKIKITELNGANVTSCTGVLAIQ